MTEQLTGGCCLATLTSPRGSMGEEATPQALSESSLEQTVHQMELRQLELRGVGPSEAPRELWQPNFSRHR